MPPKKTQYDPKKHGPPPKKQYINIKAVVKHIKDNNIVDNK